MSYFQEIVGKKWKLVEIVLDGLSMQDVAKAGAEIVLEKDQRAHGYGGCNRFFGKYSIENGILRFENLASTKMYCMETMPIEDAFFKAIYLVRNLGHDGDRLVLRSDDDLIRLVFENEVTSANSLDKKLDERTT